MNESQIFANALKFASPAERAAYLDQACVGNPQLRADVEALLRAQASDPDFLEQPPGSLADTADAPAAAGSSERLSADEPGVVLAGRYKLLELIGEGGMGTVWMAQQTEPVKRLVAVKLIKEGMGSKAVLARFEAERQALALMDHPNIAKVHDAGSTPDGRPFFVMELVKGVPITKFCDDRHLTPRQRLELFVPVCHAIQHAHQKGIIHRDLKPSNVLVVLYDDQPVPKVIDFGVAKATGQQLTEQTLHTGFGAVVGTVEYMSPEQASFNQLDIDTRSDIYSLGVLLYELLTGSPPFSRKDLEKVGVLEMLRVIREKEPSKPSTKLSTAEGLPTLAANRGMEPAKLTRLIRGELDWIVMKALEKNRGRRYETANGLARDLQRYLADEVVEARPPSAGYRLRKFVKRNLGAVVAGSLIVFLLVGGIAGTTFGLLSARRQRDEAEEARRDEAREAGRAIAAEKLATTRLAQVESEKQRADEERAVALAVNDFIQELLAQADFGSQPGAEGPRDANIKVRTVLDRAAKTIEARFANQPKVEAAIRLTIAKAYLELGLYKEAQLHAERSLELRTTHLSADHADTLTSADFLGEVYMSQQFVERAEARWRDVLVRRTATLGPDHRDTLSSKHNLGSIYLNRREFERAESLFQEVVQKREALLGAHDRETLWSKSDLAWSHSEVGKNDLAAAKFLEVQKAFESKFGEDHPGALLAKSNRALVYRRQKKYAEAEPLLREVLEKRIDLQGPTHSWTLSSKSYLAEVYCEQRKYDQAVPLLVDAIAASQASQGEDHPSTLFHMYQLARAYRDWGKLDESLPLFERTLAKVKKNLSPDDNITLWTCKELAVAYLAANMPEKAIQLHEQSLGVLKERLGSDAPKTLDVMWFLAETLLAAQQFDRAVLIFDEVLDHHRKRMEANSPRLAVFLAEPGFLLLKHKQPEKALPFFRTVLDHQRKQLGAESPQFAAWLAFICNDLLIHKQFPEAEKYLRECIAVREKTQPDAWTTFNTKSMLGGALLGQKKYADAEPLLLAGYEGTKAREKTIPPAGSTRIPEALDRLIELYSATDKPVEAAKWRAERAKYPEVAPPPRPLNH